MDEEIFLRVEGHFDAAHNLVNYQGKCANLHGHRWHVTVELGPFLEEYLDAAGIAYDFKDARPALNAELDQYDHEYLNNFFDAPSAEHIALSIYRGMQRRLDGIVYEVEVYESPESRCRVRRHGS